jgi:hypothetical protein
LKKGQQIYKKGTNKGIFSFENSRKKFSTVHGTLIQQRNPEPSTQNEGHQTNTPSEGTFTALLKLPKTLKAITSIMRNAAKLENPRCKTAHQIRTRKITRQKNTQNAQLAPL